MFHNVVIIMILMVIFYVIYKRRFWQKNRIKIMNKLLTSKSFKKAAEKLPNIGDLTAWDNLHDSTIREMDRLIRLYSETNMKNSKDVQRLMNSEKLCKDIYMKIMYIISKIDDLNINFPHDLLHKYRTLESNIIKLKVIYEFRNIKKEAVGQILDRKLIYEESFDEIKIWTINELSFKNLKKKVKEFHWLLLYGVDELFLQLHLFDSVDNTTRFFFHNLIDWFYSSLKIHIVLYLIIIANYSIYLLLNELVDVNKILFELKYEFTINEIYKQINYVLFIIIRFFTFKDIIYLLITSVKMFILAVKKYWKIITISSSIVIILLKKIKLVINFIFKTLKIAYKLIFFHELDVQKLKKKLIKFKIKNYLIFVIENYIRWIYYQFKVVFYALCLLILDFLIRQMDWINIKVVGYNTKSLFDDEQIYILNCLYWIFLIYNLYCSSYPETLFQKFIVLLILSIVQGNIMSLIFNTYQYMI
jgi:hypothetical protein